MMNQGRLALLLLILSIKAVQSLILISIFMWFKLIRETLIKREMRHIRGWALQNHHHPHQTASVRGLREMDVFNHQDELLEVLVIPKMKMIYSPLRPVWHKFKKVLYFIVMLILGWTTVWLTMKKKNQPAHRENHTLAVFGS